MPPDALQRLAPRDRHAPLGGLRVEQAPDRLVFHVDHWSSEMAPRRSRDGTLSFVTITPSTNDFSCRLDDQGAEPALVVRDAQHEYRFVATR